MSEKEDEYIEVPINDGGFVEARKVTANFGAVMAQNILKDTDVRKINFPRINYPRMKCLSYTAEDYFTIARYIKPGFIEVFERKNESLTNPGRYISFDKEHGYFLFCPTVTEFPLLEIPLYVHEITHAIQDWKKVWDSHTDNEVDGFFANSKFP